MPTAGTVKELRVVSTLTEKEGHSELTLVIPTLTDVTSAVVEIRVVVELASGWRVLKSVPTRTGTWSRDTLERERLMLTTRRKTVPSSASVRRRKGGQLFSVNQDVFFY